MRIRLAIGEEQKVRVVCTLLAANPHDPDEDQIEIGQEAEVQVEDPQDTVDELNDGRHVWSLQSDGLEGREGDD